jgi:hypothetical protein
MSCRFYGRSDVLVFFKLILTSLLDKYKSKLVGLARNQLDDIRLVLTKLLIVNGDRSEHTLAMITHTIKRACSIVGVYFTINQVKQACILICDR